MLLLQPSLRRLNAIKRTPSGLVEIGDPVECILEFPHVMTAWGTNDDLRKSVIVSLHGHSQGRLNGGIFIHRAFGLPA